MTPRELGFAASAWIFVLIVAACYGGFVFVTATRDRFWKAEQASQWRAQPLVKTQDGKTLTREQLIDAAIADFVQRQQPPSRGGQQQ